MEQNKIQFQKGYSVFEFMHHYGTEEQCRKALESARWPDGFRCPDCGHDHCCTIESRKLYQCTRCKYQTSPTNDTVFQSTKLPLTVWFLAMYFISQSKNGIAALELKRQIGVSYKTAWRMKHKLMQVMTERDEQKKLSGSIQIDDVYLGGQKPAGKEVVAPKTSNRSSPQSKRMKRIARLMSNLLPSSHLPRLKSNNGVEHTYLLEAVSRQMDSTASMPLPRPGT